MFHRWNGNKEAGRQPVRSGVETRARHENLSDWRAGRPHRPAERPPAPPPRPSIYKGDRFPVSSVRHRKRQGRVGRTVSRGRVTKPCGYEIRSDAVVLALDIFNFPSISSRYTSRRSWSRLFSAHSQYKRDLWYFSSISSEAERFNFSY